LVLNVRSRLIAGLVGSLVVLAGCGSSQATPVPTVAPSAAVDATEGLPPTLSPTLADTAAPPAAGSALPAGAVTIATFGDSLTQGDCDDAGHGYPARLLALVNQVRPGSKVVNVGHSGWTSGDLANTANDPPTDIARAIDAKPDIALVWIGSNDLWALYEYGPEPMTGQAERDDLAAYEANLDTVLRRLKNNGAAIYVALLDDQSKRPVAASPNPTEPAFPSTTAADLALMSAHVSALNDVIRRKASEYAATTVDFFDTTIFTTEATLCSDGNHPNESGYDAIAARWFAALEPALK
jgi:lysophospholipase L1-like esterase